MIKANLLAAMFLGLGAAAPAAEVPSPSPIKIAVFPFELEDFSAAGQAGSAPNEAKYLFDSTEEARRLLVQSGRYLPMDTGSASRGHDFRDCNGCEAATAAKLGSDQSLIGVVTKISMTEYTVRIEVRDAHSGEIVADLFTDLRIGADYSWSRGVRWLIENRMLQTNGNSTPAHVSAGR
jgi:hypothetical protein